LVKSTGGAALVPAIRAHPARLKKNVGCDISTENTRFSVRQRTNGRRNMPERLIDGDRSLEEVGKIYRYLDNGEVIFSFHPTTDDRIRGIVTELNREEFIAQIAYNVRTYTAGKENE
jgi:hypothetical protein